MSGMCLAHSENSLDSSGRGFCFYKKLSCKPPFGEDTGIREFLEFLVLIQGCPGAHRGGTSRNTKSRKATWRRQDGRGWPARPPVKSLRSRASSLVRSQTHGPPSGGSDFRGKGEAKESVLVVNTGLRRPTALTCSQAGACGLVLPSPSGAGQHGLSSHTRADGKLLTSHRQPARPCPPQTLLGGSFWA